MHRIDWWQCLGVTGPSVDEPAGRLAAAEFALVSEFPDVPADMIHALVVREGRRFDNARVRGYLPLLITRSVRTRLRQLHPDIQLG